MDKLENAMITFWFLMGTLWFIVGIHLEHIAWYIFGGFYFGYGLSKLLDNSYIQYLEKSVKSLIKLSKLTTDYWNRAEQKVIILERRIANSKPKKKRGKK